jgi:putative intracellular protease/amidase
MKVLMVLTSHDTLGNTGRKTGFWLEELAAPYYAFRNAGAEIVLASPKGGQPRSTPRATSLPTRPKLPAASRPTATPWPSWPPR